MADLIGQQISNYQIQALLGSGAFADVYIGTHIYLGNYAAIKVLRTKLIGEEHDPLYKRLVSLLYLFIRISFGC